MNIEDIKSLNKQYLAKTLKLEFAMGKYRACPTLTQAVEVNSLEWDIQNYNTALHSAQKSYDQAEATKKQWLLIKSRKICFFTINPSTKHTMTELKLCLTKFLAKKWLQDTIIYYAFEQRGETLEDCGKGFHLHILFHKPTGKNTQPTMLINQTYNTFKSLYDNPKETAIKQIKKTAYKIYIPEFYEEKLAYICGDKWDEDKLLKTTLDKTFRENNNLRLYYKIKNGETQETEEKTTENT